MPSKEYYWANREKCLAEVKRYRQENPEKRKENDKKYREKHAEELKEYKKRYFEKNHDKIMQYHKEYREKRKEEVQKWRRDWYHKHREASCQHSRIVNAVNKAIKKGILTRQPCEMCGAEQTQAHHCDYSKPLNVMWLCSKCHAQWHKENVPKNSPYKIGWRD